MSAALKAIPAHKCLLLRTACKGRLVRRGLPGRMEYKGRLVRRDLPGQLVCKGPLD